MLTAEQLLKELKLTLPDVLAHESYLILEHCCGITRQDLLFNRKKEITPEQVHFVRSCLARRCKGEPLQYIFGYFWFCGEKILVRENVLIPRQETELLVIQVVKRAKEIRAKEVLDLCCGTGCIGLAVAKQTEAHVTLGDISPFAMELTKENALLWEISEKVTVTEMDAENLPIDKKYDIIVSNPPYIKTGDMAGLDREVRDFEPSLALDGGNDGLHFYQKIAVQATSCLRDGGYLLFEAGDGQSMEIMAFMTAFKKVRSYPDLCEKERIVEGMYCI